MTRFEFLKICHQCQKVTHYVIVIVIVRFIVVVLANVSITVTTSDCKIVRARSTIGSRPRPTHPPKIPSLVQVWFGLVSAGPVDAALVLVLWIKDTDVFAQEFLNCQV